MPIPSRDNPFPLPFIPAIRSWMAGTLALSTTLGLAAHAAPPVNDTCNGAVVVGAGTHSGFSTLEATAEFPEDFSKCGEIFTGPDIWFRFNPEIDGDWTISTCGSSFPTNLAIYRYECEGSSDCRGCSSLVSCAAFDPNACAGGAARVTLGLSGCGDCGFFGYYYIRVSGVAAGDVGSVALSIAPASSNPCNDSSEPCSSPHKSGGCALPACCASVCAVDPTCCAVAWDIGCVEQAASTSGCGNFYFCNPNAGGPENDCANRALEVFESGAYPFDLDSARNDGPTHCGMAAKSLWWRLTPNTSGTALVSTCRLTNFNARVAVYDLGSGDPTQFDFNQFPLPIACDFEDLCGSAGDTVVFEATAGNTYLVRVENEFGTPAGSGRIAIRFPWEYTCASSAVTNDCAAEVTGTTATLVSTEVVASGTIAFDTAGATQDGPFVLSGANFATAHDIWFWVRARRDGTIDATTCGSSSAPVSLEIYDLGPTVDAADFANLPARVRASSGGVPTTCATVSSEAIGLDYYLVRIAALSRDSFPAGALTISVPSCQDLPPTLSESEPCGTDINGGCSTNGSFLPIAVGQTMEGTFGHAPAGAAQDSDWYLLTLDSGMAIEIECASNHPASVTIRSDILCSESPYAVSDPGFCSTTSFCLPAGQHAIVVQPIEPVTGSGCTGPSYRLRVSGVAALCASVGDDDVVALPPRSVSSTSPAEVDLSTGVACAASDGTLQPPSFATEYAQPFLHLSQKSGGFIEVIDFAWMHQYPESVINGVIELYDDIDGGAPFREGEDLVLIESRPFQLWESLGTTHRWKLHTPRALANFAGNPVVVLKLPATDGGFAAFAGAVAPGCAPTYLRSLACALTKGTEDFIPLANAFEMVQWAVTVRGTFGSSCAADINNDGSVDAADLSLLLADWGGDTTPSDLDSDCSVGAADLSLLLASWGPCE